MIQRPTLFDKPPASRSSDLESSHEAEHEINTTGRRDDSCMEVYFALCRFDGSTSRELSVLADMDRHEAAKRLSDLRARGDVKHCKDGTCEYCDKNCEKAVMRKCDISKRLALVWWQNEP